VKTALTIESPVSVALVDAAAKSAMDAEPESTAHDTKAYPPDGAADNATGALVGTWLAPRGKTIDAQMEGSATTVNMAEAGISLKSAVNVASPSRATVVSVDDGDATKPAAGGWTSHKSKTYPDETLAETGTTAPFSTVVGADGDTVPASLGEAAIVSVGVSAAAPNTAVKAMSAFTSRTVSVGDVEYSAAPSVQRMKRKPVEVTAVTVELEPPYCAVCGLTPLMEPPTPDV
jgi:hypothetical protein